MTTAHTSRTYRTVPIAAQYIAADTQPERVILKPQQNAEHYAQVAIGESQHSLGLPSTLLQDQFVGMAFITQYTGLTDKWFYKLIQDGNFPKPIKFGRSSRWLKSEVEAWVQERIQSSRPGAFGQVPS